ncbi:MAG: hypothetical protein DPW14_10140 [Planctomycetes bacterium]|nr:hypothetical protein [Planctomycetota bacterium]
MSGYSKSMLSVLLAAGFIASALAGRATGIRGVSAYGLPISFTDMLNEGYVSVDLIDQSSPNQNVPAPYVVNLPNNEGGYTEFFSSVEAESYMEIDADVHISLGITQGTNTPNGRGEQTASNAWEAETVRVETTSSQDGEAIWSVLLVQRVWHQVYVQWDAAAPSQSTNFDAYIESMDIKGNYNTTRVTGSYDGGNVGITATGLRSHIYEGDTPMPIDVSARTNSGSGWQVEHQGNESDGEWTWTAAANNSYSVLIDGWYETTVMTTYSSTSTPDSDQYSYDVYGSWNLTLEDLTSPPAALDPTKESQLTCWHRYGNYIFVWEVQLLQNFDTSDFLCPAVVYQNHSFGQPNTP